MKRARDYVPVPGRDGRVVLVSTSIRISYKSIKKEQVSLDRRRFEEFWPQYAASSGSPDNITSRSPAGPSLTETVQTYLLVLRMTTVLKARAKIPVHEAAGDTPSLQPVSELTSRSSGAACVECGVETIPLCKHAAADSGPESSPVKTSHELKMYAEITKHDTLPIAAIRSEDRGSQHCKQAQVCFAEQSTSLVVSSRLHMSLQRFQWAERQRNASHVFASFSLANIPGTFGFVELCS
ncbi:uncharacterized protein SEPMUDRAFT_119268 [Sphaerulina musiva SO2202]|uniref:Uncharacterized protein n=1 Tax=Sphaerulina musiva (strain SO2202) TaxID=692275 RepID=N1QJM4_SPHMS|nr:uncharacterized protein SEPMUDRAFT_119268 [Sphaerulina musiva SO2202]EMF10739.1 hypothetical protein SEPMUDRAFT_119268 [Sphaerulina musiva SO2202]